MADPHFVDGLLKMESPIIKNGWLIPKMDGLYWKIHLEMDENQGENPHDLGLAWTALGGKTLVVEARGRVPASNVSWSEDGLVPSG